MDGFYTTDGLDAMAYYTAAELPFYYGLFETSTLCVNYFCSVLGPTWPNRFYLTAGTAGGITTNGVWGYGVFDYPIILDLLDAADVSWKVYNIGWDSVPQGLTDNVFVFWERYAKDYRARASRSDYFRDLDHDRLPQVSFIIPSYGRGWDEHPPADVSVGMRIQRRLIRALRNSSSWDTSAYIITYDEHGGYFDHVPPPQFDAYGAGIRVPTWVVSPFAKPQAPGADRVRALLDPEAAGDRLRPADPCLGEPPVRYVDAGRAEQRGRGRRPPGSAGAPSRRPDLDRRHAGVLRVLRPSPPAARWGPPALTRSQPPGCRGGTSSRRRPRSRRSRPR